MTWFKTDDGYYDHPKFLDLSNAAVGLWSKAGAWCGRHLTDGVIPATQVRALKGTPAQVRDLISVGLWIETRTDSGAKAYRFHDWNEYQPTREEKLKQRADTAERQRKSRERKKADQGKSENVTRDSREPVTRDSRDCHANLSQRPDPTRPDPTLLSTGGGENVREVGGGENNAPPPEIPAEWIERPNLARCPEHVGMTPAPACWKCRDAKQTAAAAASATARAERTRLAADAAARLACDMCDDTGHVLGDDRRPLVPAIPCRHDQDDNAEAIMAARAAAEDNARAAERARDVARRAAADARARRAELAAHRRPTPEAVNRDPFSA